MSLNYKYRPKSFSEVRGQNEAARLVSGFALGRVERKSLLLFGAVGNGKTSLVRLFAQALNCLDVGEDGSPCQLCAMCLMPPHIYLKEYNTPAFKDDAERVGEILRAENRTPSETRFKVLFFDEAHCLGKLAQDRLLKPVEDPAPGVLFCFATTERNKLRPALRSRLFPVPIKPLMPSDAIELLEYLADKEGITYDRQAFSLLASATPPHARDLVNGLEELQQFGGHVDVELVKNVFELSVCDRLTAYFLALADQNVEAQIEASAAWQDEIAVKVAWIERFLTTVYYNDVLGKKVVINRLCYGMDDLRIEFIRRLSARLRVSSPRALAPFFRKMLEFWTGPQTRDPDILGMRLILFEDLANEELEVGPVDKKTIAISGTVRPDVDAGLTVTAQHEWETVPVARESRFIEHDDVRKIINRASFLIQQYNLLMNGSYRIKLSLSGNESEEVCSQRALSCCRMLEAMFADVQERVDAILLMEREKDQIIGRLVAHVPVASSADLRGHLVQRWLDWAESNNIEIVGGLSADSPDVQYHWRAVYGLCAGYEADSGSVDALRELLGIRKGDWRHPGPFAGPRLCFSSRLSSSAIVSASANGMNALSAFDVAAWSEIHSGWEGHEYFDRREEAERRRTRIAAVREKHRGNTASAKLAIEEELGEWCSLPPGTWPHSWSKEW